MQVFEDYAKAFPGTMPDHRGMAGEDFDNLEALMAAALERGRAIGQGDLKHPVAEPDPESGLVL